MSEPVRARVGERTSFAQRSGGYLAPGCSARLPIPALLFSALLFTAAATGAGATDGGLEPRMVPDKAMLARLPAGSPSRRIIIKFQQGSRMEVHSGELRAAAGVATASVSDALVALGVSPRALRRLHARPPADLVVEREQGEAGSGRALADLNLYYTLDLPAGVDPAAALDRLSRLPAVEFAEPELAPAPAPIDLAPPSPNLVPQQGYRAAAPAGIGVFPASVAGGDGLNVRLVDIEYSWLLDHEDLERAEAINIDPSPAWDPYPDDESNHGTAVLGELVGRGNGYGVTGIAPRTLLRVAPAATYAFGYNPARAISLATGVLRAGDVILLEQQMSVCGLTYYGPVEWSQSVYDAIATATALGIVVVEAAGNGAVNLDAAGCQGLFTRSVRDSRALIVGAGSPTTHGRLSYSSYGSRLDAQGWGSGVTSTGYGDAFDPGDLRQRYTGSFSGTSSASSMVAGAVVAVQGALKGRGLRAATPLEMREALDATGTPQSGSGQIGALPNLPAALAWLVDRIAPAPGWQAWDSFTGALGTQAPGCLSTSAAQTDCWAPSAAGGLGWWRYAGSGLPAMQGLGGQPATPPSCVAAGGKLQCFVATTSGALAQIALTGTSWSGWTSLDGSIRNRPACVSVDGTRIDCIALGTDGKLRWRFWSGTAWGFWQKLAASLTFSAEPTWFARDGGIDCLAADQGRRARYLHRTAAGVWEAPVNLLGSVQQAPSCVSDSNDGFSCFFLGGDLTLREITYNGSAWSNWTTRPGPLASAPACVRTGASALRCFAAGSGGILKEARKTGSTWQAWESLGGTIRPLRPACVASGSARIDCFAAGTNGRLAHLAWY